MKLPVYLHRTESAGVGTLYSNARRSSAAIPEPGELLSHEDGKGCSLGLQNRFASYPKRWQSLMTKLAQAAEVFYSIFPKRRNVSAMIRKAIFTPCGTLGIIACRKMEFSDAI